MKQTCWEQWATAAGTRHDWAHRGLTSKPAARMSFSTDAPLPAAGRRALRGSTDHLPAIYNDQWNVNLCPISPAKDTTTCNDNTVCLCGSLAQCALSLKQLSAGPGFNPRTRQNKLFHDYWRACFEINFSNRQQGLTVSSIICDR